jgi:hypothetical protein
MFVKEKNDLEGNVGVQKTDILMRNGHSFNNYHGFRGTRFGSFFALVSL